MSRATHRTRSLAHRLARALPLPLFVAALVAAWSPSTSEGDYAVTWGEPVLTLNDNTLEWSDVDQGYRLVLAATVVDEEEAQANGVAPADGAKAEQEYEVIVDLADPEAERPTPCGWDFEARHVRVCTCHRLPPPPPPEGEPGDEPEDPPQDPAQRPLAGLCDSLLEAAATFTLTSAGRACPAGTFPQAHLAVADETGAVYYDKLTSRTRDLEASPGVELIFPEVTLHISSAYGIWDLAAGAQEIRLSLRPTVAGEPGLGDWASSDLPEELSSYEFGFLLWVGFLGWGLPPLELHYSRPLQVEQLVP